MTSLLKKRINTVPNWINGTANTSKSKEQLPVYSPLNGETIAFVPLSTKKDLDTIVTKASSAQKLWQNTPMNQRVQVMFTFKRLLEENLELISQIIHKENGKTVEEAKAELIKGIECVEFAASLPQIASGEVLHVSRGIECKMLRCPIGVVAGITPFNFPAMVPLWMIPLALSLGNSFILKPSEQTPLASIELATLLQKAGLPDGVFSVVQGDKSIVEAICNHPLIKAVGFVGSTSVAQKIYSRVTQQGKRARCMGGAKNHLTVVSDANPEMASSNVVASVVGCAGQRCMAASVLLAVGEVDHIIDLIHTKMKNLIPGKDFGPVINMQSKERICGYLERAEKNGAKLLLDGRASPVDGSSTRYYIGPSIINHASAIHESACKEIFGPLLTIIRVENIDEALSIENANPYGNAASIYTSSGALAEYYQERANAGMIGINIGVPVPREPFSFGGWNLSRFGDGDITGLSAIEFWSQPKKVTTKWEAANRSNWMS